MPQISQQMRQEAQQNNQINPLLELLGSLLQTAQQQQGKMANVQSEIAYNQQRMGGGGSQPQKPQTNQNQDPIQMLTSLLSMSNQQQPMQSAYTKGVDKALKESGYAHATEALTQGVDPMHISNEANRMGMMLGQQTAMQQPLLQNLSAMSQQPQQPAQSQMTPIQQQAQQIAQPTKNPVMGALDAVFGIGTNYKSRQLENLGKAQEIMGEQPLQQGDKEKLTYDFANEINKELMKSNNPDALTPEVSAKFNLLIEGSDAVREAANFLKEDPGVQWSLPNFMKSQKSRQYELAVKRMIDNKNRLETGASMNKEELDKAYQKYKPGKTDNPETMRRRLQPLSKFYEGSLNTADPTGIHRKRASGDSNKETTIGRFQVRYH